MTMDETPLDHHNRSGGRRRLPSRGADPGRRRRASSLPPPLRPEVFRERQAKLKAAAKARGLDVVLVTPSTNLSYIANLSMGRSERLTALLLFADGPSSSSPPPSRKALSAARPSWTTCEPGKRRRTRSLWRSRLWEERPDRRRGFDRVCDRRAPLRLRGRKNGGRTFL